MSFVYVIHIDYIYTVSQKTSETLCSKLLIFKRNAV